MYKRIENYKRLKEWAYSHQDDNESVEQYACKIKYLRNLDERSEEDLIRLFLTGLQPEILNRFAITRKTLDEAIAVAVKIENDLLDEALNNLTDSEKQNNEKYLIKSTLEKIPYFDGYNIPVNEFLNECENALSIIDVAWEQSFLESLKNKLKDRAHDKLKDRYLLIFNDFKIQLLEHFGSRQAYEELWAKLGYMRQNDNENVFQYAERIRCLNRVVGNRSRDIVNKYLIESFVCGLKPEIFNRLNPTYNSLDKTVLDAIAIENHFYEEVRFQKKHLETDAKNLMNPSPIIDNYKINRESNKLSDIRHKDCSKNNKKEKKVCKFKPLKIYSKAKRVVLRASIEPTETTNFASSLNQIDITESMQNLDCPLNPEDLKIHETDPSVDRVLEIRKTRKIQNLSDPKLAFHINEPFVEKDEISNIINREKMESPELNTFPIFYSIKEHDTFITDNKLFKIPTLPFGLINCPFSANKKTTVKPMLPCRETFEQNSPLCNEVNLNENTDHKVIIKDPIRPIDSSNINNPIVTNDQSEGNTKRFNWVGRLLKFMGFQKINETKINYTNIINANIGNNVLNADNIIPTIISSETLRKNTSKLSFTSPDINFIKNELNENRVLNKAPKYNILKLYTELIANNSIEKEFEKPKNPSEPSIEVTERSMQSKNVNVTEISRNDSLNNFKDKNNRHTKILQGTASQNEKIPSFENTELNLATFLLKRKIFHNLNQYKFENLYSYTQEKVINYKNTLYNMSEVFYFEDIILKFTAANSLVFNTMQDLCSHAANLEINLPLQFMPP